jgi:hypothetical protein
MNICMDMRKLCAKWVPRAFTIDQKQQRVDDSEHCLAIFNHNKDEFFHRYITMDETWLIHYTPESNPDSQPSRLNAINRIRSVERRNGQLARLWHQYTGFDIISIDYLEKGQTINSKYYKRYWSV